MAKKIEINENWEPVEVEDLDNLFVVIFKQGSFEQGYIEAFDTDDALMQSAYDSLAKQYDDCGCDELTQIYLIKVPNTKQTVDMCNTGLFNGNCCDPHVIEATRELFNRADCEQLSCWEGCGLTEAKKKKKRNKNKVIIPGGYLTVTTGDPALNIKHFNNCMGTGGLQNPDAPHLVVGDTLPNGPVADTSSSNAGSGESGAASGGEGGGMGESLDEKDEKSLTEAHLDYSKQLDKMRQLENGTRGFNAASASLEKILFNYDICISHNLPKARKAMEDALRMHGWDSFIKPTKTQVNISDYDRILKPGYYINIAAAKIVLAEKDNAQQLIKAYGKNLDDLLITLIIALGIKEAALAGAIKDHIINNFTVTLTELKDFLNKYFANPAALASLNQIIHDCRESLVEDTAYSHKLGTKFEVPPQIKLLDQAQVEDFIKQLAPEELFRVGYVTPLYFYSELDDKFNLVKATEMEGYTGLDYRDASVDAADHDERVANAQRQIDTYINGAEGHKLNREGEKFSTSYRATNKLALNPAKSNEYVEYELDADGKPILDAKGEKVIKSKIDMNKILFYPKVGSVPITHYYVDFHNGQGFKPIKREVLVDTLYKFITEVEKANAMGVSKTDLM